MIQTRKRALVLGMLALAVVAGSAFKSAFLTTVTVRVVGPFYTSPMPFDSTLGNQVGGHVQFYLAADSCRIGQLVALTSARSVAPTTTLATYNKLVGVVVGGTRTGMQASLAVADTSTLAATANQKVIVMDIGRYWLLDSGAVPPGSLVSPALGGSLTAAGRIKIMPTAIDSNYRAVGRAIDTILIGKAGLVQIHIK